MHRIWPSSALEFSFPLASKWLTGQVFLMRAFITTVFLIALFLTTFFLTIQPLQAYPVDGGEQTGIQRLITAKSTAKTSLPKGANWSMQQVQLKLLNQTITLPKADLEFEQRLQNLLGDDKDNYALALLDLSDKASPLYAEYNAQTRFNPGSVGKLMVGLAYFQALADRFPEDIAARRALLMDTWVTADKLIVQDHHEVVLIDPLTQSLTARPLKIGDQGNIWTYLDWMFSASSNAAASMVIKELVLFNAFQQEYESKRLDADVFLRQQPKAELSRHLKQALQQPISRNGLDSSKLQQGGFFTHTGKSMIPGSNSYATPAELIRFLVKMEQGLLVDEFSSLELKRLLYLTQKRIRYASSPALSNQAVFFKSGSLYRCKPEEGFVCRKYRGNVENLLNSVAIIESPSDAPVPIHYMVVVTSNVLRKNSAVEHQTLATRIHRLIVARHSTPSAPVQQK